MCPGFWVHITIVSVFYFSDKESIMRPNLPKQLLYKDFEIWKLKPVDDIIYTNKSSNTKNDF